MQQINFYEFIGIMIGDGCVLHYPRHRIYGIEISGNADEEKDYYQKIAKFIKEKYNLNPKVFVKKSKQRKGLKLRVYNKRLAENLIAWGISGNKTFTTKIPEELLLDWQKSKFVIRGIFETDGSLYFSKTKIP